MTDPDLERRFHRTMIGIHETAKRELGYNATRFIQMVAEHGGVETARRLVMADTPSDGFTVLWERGRLELTVEAHVVSKEFRPLFTDPELRAAEARLRAYEFRGTGE